MSNNNDFKDFTDTFYSFVEKYSWLFQESKEGFLDLSDYIAYFTKTHKLCFSFYKYYKYYNLNLLEKYKENLISVKTYLLNNGQVQYYALFQFSKKEHLVVDFIYKQDRKEFLANLTLYSTNAADFYKRLGEFKEFEFIEEEKERIAGFSYKK